METCSVESGGYVVGKRCTPTIKYQPKFTVTLHPCFCIRTSPSLCPRHQRSTMEWGSVDDPMAETMQSTVAKNNRSWHKHSRLFITLLFSLPISSVAFFTCLRHHSYCAVDRHFSASRLATRLGAHRLLFVCTFCVSSYHSHRDFAKSITSRCTKRCRGTDGERYSFHHLCLYPCTH